MVKFSLRMIRFTLAKGEVLVRRKTFSEPSISHLLTDIHSAIKQEKNLDDRQCLYKIADSHYLSKNEKMCCLGKLILMIVNLVKGRGLHTDTGLYRKIKALEQKDAHASPVASKLSTSASMQVF